MDNPHAWDEMMRFIHPILMADTFVFEKDDHADDELPIEAWEWDVL